MGRPLSLALALLLAALPTGAQEAPAGYPVEDFLAMTTFSDLALSPDGMRLAFVTSRDDFEADETRSAVWLLETTTGSEPRRVTWENARYGSLSWSPDGTRLGFVSTRDDAEAGQLFALAMGPGDPRPLTSEERFPRGVRSWDWSGDGDAVVVATLEELPDSVTDFYGDIRYYGGPTAGALLYRVPLEDAVDGLPEPARLARLDDVVDGVRVNPVDGRILVLRGVPTEPEVHLGSLDRVELGILPGSVPGEGEVREPRWITDNRAAEGDPRWLPDGRSIVFTSSFGHPDSVRAVMSRGEVHRLDPVSGRVTGLAPDYQGSISQVVVRGDGTLLALAARSTGTDVVAIDPETGSHRVVAEFPDRVYGLTAAGDRVAFARSTGQAFDEIFMARSLEGVPSAPAATRFNAELTAATAPAVEAFRWTNSDGQTIEGVLYWPPGMQGRQGLPLVVDIHGGPWSSRTAALAATGGGWAYYPALLASRGYLVLEPNYRGGTGRGLDFLRALEGYSCSRPADDVLTGVDALVERGWADPERMGVMGYSYGGLMTNCLIGRTNRFRVAASGAGLWNDASYFGSSDNFGQTDIRYEGLAPWEDPERFWDESPISRAGAIETPTLIVFGGADRRVPVEQGLELYRALEYRGIPSELLVFPGQAHGFTRPEYKLKKVQAELRWIDSYLKGERRSIVW